MATAVDHFLRIDGIEGESADAEHRGWIDVESWSWGAANAGAAASGSGGGAGRVTMQDVHVTMRTSQAGPQLFLACASGRHLREARLAVVRGGAQRLEFLTVTLTDVLVSSYHAGATEAGDVPIDSVGLTFARLVVAYRPQAADGSAQPPVTTGWDVKRNTRV